MDRTLSGTTGRCRILTGSVARELPALVGSSRTVIVTDANVRRLHASSFPAGEVLEIGLGEAAKSLETVAGLYQRFLELGLERDALVLGFGGGVVGDVAAFAAATWLRGMKVGLVPTTLLAQADAGVGGKNGVNFGGLKNLVGTIRQPSFVVCDPAFLRTLPTAELANGLAEVVKSAAIGDAALFEFLERHAAPLLAMDEGALARAVADSLSVKVGIVERDELETGERRLLNFGHTLGHAVEATLGVRHGEGVAVGMLFAARLSAKRGLLPSGVVGRLEELLAKLGLPTRLAGNHKALAAALTRDKKRHGTAIRMALLKAIGEAIVEPIEIGEIESALEDLH